LRIWVLLAVVLGTSVAFDLPPLRAALAATIGFLARWALLALFGQIAAGFNHLFRGGGTAPQPRGGGANTIMSRG
jgi:hypothetical protein